MCARADPYVKIVNGATSYTSPPASLPVAALGTKQASSSRGAGGDDDKASVMSGSSASAAAASGSVEIRLGSLARVQGDVKVSVMNSWGKVASFWFHTSFLQDQGHLVLWKRGLDGPVKDKKHKVFPSNFSGMRRLPRPFLAAPA